MATTRPLRQPGPAGAGVQAPDVVRRFAAKLVDAAVATLLFWITASVLPAGMFTTGLFAAIVAGAYWLVGDGLEVEFMRHRSLGKRLLGLAVVRLDGRPMDLEASIRRNWMFAIGFFSTIFGSLALSLLMLLAATALLAFETFRVAFAVDGRRWGDDLAATRVVEA